MTESEHIANWIQAKVQEAVTDFFNDNSKITVSGESHQPSKDPDQDTFEVIIETQDGKWSFSTRLSYRVVKKEQNWEHGLARFLITNLQGKIERSDDTYKWTKLIDQQK